MNHDIPVLDICRSMTEWISTPPVMPVEENNSYVENKSPGNRIKQHNKTQYEVEFFSSTTR